jgi:hypothetical protein
MVRSIMAASMPQKHWTLVKSEMYGSLWDLMQAENHQYFSAFCSRPTRATIPA